MGCILNESTLQGHRILTLENHWFQASVDISHGAHIFEFRDKTKNIDFMHKDPKGLDYDVGGWYELFPNSGQACDYQGISIPKHGDIQHQSWTYKVLVNSEAQIEIELSAQSEVLPLRLDKNIRIVWDQPCLFINERITNTSASCQPYLWGHHVTFGEAVVDEFCRIDLPLCRIYKRNGIEPPGSRLAREASGTLTDMPGKQGDRLDLSYFPASPFSEMLFIDQMQSHWYNLYNSQKQTGFGLCWNGEVFPYLWLWQENRFISTPPYNGQKRAMALEPQSSNEPILEQALKAGKAPYLEAGESVETWLTAVIHHEPQQVTQITQDGTLATHGEFMKTIYGN